MALLGKQTCTQCGKEFSRHANFCPYCGAPASRGKAVCGHCGASISAAATYCPECGRPAEETAVPTLVSNRWARGPEEFATRVEVEDVRGFFRKGLIVEAGTKAIFLHDGRNVGVLGPDRYSMDNLFKRIVTLGSAERITAILVDSGEVDLDFTVPGLYTTDPLQIELGCRVAVQVANPVLFFTNLMKGRRSFSLRQLRAYLFDEIQNAASEAVGRHSVTELSSNLALKQEFATDIEAHLNRTFERVGLGFDRLRTLDYRHERFDAVTGIREEIFLQVSEEEAKLEGRKRLFDVYDATEVQAIAEETAKVRYFEERAQVWERLRRAVLSDRMADVRSEEEWAEFVAEVDRRQLIRGDELETLRREFAERKEDHEATRAHFVAKASLERDYELRMVELHKRRDLAVGQIELAQEIERRRVDGQQEIEEKRWTFELRRQREEAEFRRAQQQLDDVARRESQIEETIKDNEIALAQAKTQAEVEAIEREQDRLDLELGMLALEKMKAVQRRDQEERNRIELERQRGELEMTLQAERQRLELRLQEVRLEREHELQRLRALGELSAEALIAASGPQQAQLLAELRRTETLKGMDSEQILAMAAERSPAVAQAFQEKFRAMAEGKMSEREQVLYERLLAEHKELAQAQRETAEEQARRQQELAGEALRTQAEVAKAFAGSRPAPGPTVVIPGGVGTYGGPTVVGEGGAVGGEVQVCPSCHVRQPVGRKFCENCGHQFYE